MKTEAFLVMLLCLSQGGLVHTERTDFRCDYAYHEEARGWLKLHEIPTDWYNARHRCRLEGAQLASPTAEIADTVKNIVAKNSSLNTIFTGIHGTYSSGDFFSLEGVPLFNIPHTWADGEPNNLGGRENCLVLRRDGHMEDVDCDSKYPYMCFKKYESLTTTDCGTVDPAYQKYSSGSCYKFHSDIKDWSAAFMTCAAEGGHLAVINSYSEAQIIRSILDANPSDSLPKNSPKYGARIGIRLEDGEWRTVQGETLSQAGYSDFAPGEPNNLDGNQLCGGVFRSTGLLDDISCFADYPYICEKKPEDIFCTKKN